MITLQRVIITDPSLVWIRGYAVSDMVEEVKFLYNKYHKKSCRVWTPYGGFNNDGKIDPIQALKTCASDKIPTIFTGFYQYLNIRTLPAVVHLVRELAEENAARIIIAGGFGNLPHDIDKFALVVDWDPLSKEQIKERYLKLVEKSLDASVDKYLLEDEVVDKVTYYLKGLSTLELINIVSIASAISQNKEMFLNNLLDGKRNILKKAGLEVIFNPPSFDMVGGMPVLKDWLIKRKKIIDNYTKAKNMCLEYPKGILLLGVPGTGKSLVSKSVGGLLGMPVVRMDLSKIFGSLVGASESNITSMLSQISEMSPIVLWIDEIEKAFSGVESSGRSDAGTTARVVNIFLTWMQERTEGVFVVATANSLDLPVEFLRKERFDEIFYIPVPDRSERKEIFEIHLKSRKLNVDDFEMDTLLEASFNFTGAEIETAIKNALTESFFIESPVTTTMLLNELKKIKPIVYNSNVDKIAQWADKFAVYVSNRSSETKKIRRIKDESSN